MEDHPSEEERIRREQELLESSGETEPSRESVVRPDETVRMPLPDPMAQAAALCRRYPDTYKGILRAAARNLEKDHTTRHRIYTLLGCEDRS